MGYGHRFGVKLGANMKLVDVLWAGWFNDELTPVQIKKKGKMVDFMVDEHARPSVDMAALGRLPSVFKKGGAVSPGNASGVCDGAGAIVMAGEDAVKEHGLKPLARLVSYSYVGVDPTVMGIGPVPAIEKLLSMNGLNRDQVGIYDIMKLLLHNF